MHTFSPTFAGDPPPVMWHIDCIQHVIAKLQGTYIYVWLPRLEVDIWRVLLASFRRKHELAFTKPRDASIRMHFHTTAANMGDSGQADMHSLSHWVGMYHAKVRAIYEHHVTPLFRAVLFSKYQPLRYIRNPQVYPISQCSIRHAHISSRTRLRIA